MPEPIGQIDTLSVVFTDLVSSTELRVRLGEAAADELRRVHDALLTEAVLAHNGTVVKGLGDGLMVTFPSAVDAVNGAIAVQQAATAHGVRVPEQLFEVRVGIALGDVSTEDGDAFGVPIVEAARLCGAAAPGEILATDIVRALARGRSSVPFEPMGELTLKGLPEPVASCRVIWEPLSQGDLGSGVPVPAALLGAVTEYIGRPELREKMASFWQIARDGACRTVLLAGEPGVGKTRTASEVARRAHAEGAVVLYGRCDEDLAVPYQPFVEALEHYTRHAEAPELGRLAGELRRLDPQLAERMPDLPDPIRSDPASEEHRLFEAVASWLAAVAASSPAGLVVVLDDIHWATKPTLQLFQHVVRAAGSEAVPLLVLATYRDTDIDRSHPLSAALADLRRIDSTERLSVANLTEDEVIRFIEAAAGTDLDDDARRLAVAVFEETEGNPFFVGEVMRHMIESGGVRREGDRWVVTDPDHVAVPEGVRDVVGRRLTRLSELTNDVLSTAAVYGRDFEVDPLLAIVNCSEDEALDALDDAVRARLVEEVGVDRYRFSHALVRTTLYEEMSATRQRRLHRRVADVLEKLRPDDVTALAHHCTQAGPDGGDVSRALRYTLAAAEAALAARAFADAEVQFANAIELLGDEVPADDEAERLVLTALCGLGEAQRDQGNAAYRETLLGAARRALALGDVAFIKRAVVANSRGLISNVSAFDDERIELLEAALVAVANEGAAVRARIMAHLAAETAFDANHERRFQMIEEAIALARSADDEVLLAHVLTVTAYSGMSSRRWALTQERTDEARRLADVAGDPTLRVLSRIWASGASLALGDVATSERLLVEAVTIGQAEATPTILWMANYNHLRHLSMIGDLDRADEINGTLLARGTELGQGDAEQFWQCSAAASIGLRGYAGLLADPVGSFAASFPGTRAWSAVHAQCLAMAGRLDEARNVAASQASKVDELMSEPFAFGAVAHLARCAWWIDDAALAITMADALEPHRGGWVHYHVGCDGPVTWFLGLARATTGDFVRAIEDLEAALADVIRQDCPPFVPHIRRDLALVHRKRGAFGDEELATQILTTALAEATEMGLAGAVEEITGLLAGQPVA